VAHSRLAEARDADAIAAIYNHAIDERVATFETRHRTAAEIEQALPSADRFPLIVAEHGGEVTAFARVGGYSAREAYRGVGELMLYVHPEHRRGGVGRQMAAAIADAARERGYWKLIALVFTSNEPMVGLLNACGYDEVGVHRRHGQLDGEWRDVLVLELLLDAG
jgi:phosphinothricin acetyltransferase